jgi:spermidine/putrescine transport system ATP-binding protein
MNDGKIEQLGTPQELYEQPATKFVAGFIGTSNVVQGKVVQVSGNEAELLTGPEERVVLRLRAPASGGDIVAATVRPEKMALASQPTPGCCTLRGTVSEVVYLGTSTNYTVETILGQLVVFQLNAGDHVATPQRGDQTWVSWPTTSGYQLLEPPEEST